MGHRRSQYEPMNIVRRPLPFMLAANIPYELDVFQFVGKNVHPITRMFEVTARSEYPSYLNFDFERSRTTYHAAISVGDLAPVYGRKKFKDLSNVEQNLILSHEMLHVLITFHPYLIETTNKLDAIDKEESAIIADIIIDFIATFLTNNYLFGVMTGFKNLLLFHNHTFLAMAKNLNVFLATQSAMSHRFLYLQESLLESTHLRKPNPSLLNKYLAGSDLSAMGIDIYNRLTSDLLQLAAWTKAEHYDFLADPELASDTEFIQKIRELLERFIEGTTQNRVAQQTGTSSTPSNPVSGSPTPEGESFSPDLGISDAKNVTNLIERTLVQNIKENLPSRTVVNAISASDINASVLKEQTEELLDDLNTNKYGVSINRSMELRTSTISRQTLVEAKREVMHFMDHAMQLAMQDPTGVNGTSLTDGTEGSFHFNTNGAIQAVQKVAHPALFRTITTSRIKRKTILAAFDVSGSMQEFDEQLKPWFSAFFVSNLKAYFTVKVVDFATALIRENLPYNKTAIAIGNDGGTDPFGFSAGTPSSRVQVWKEILHDVRPDIIVFISDMGFYDPAQDSILYQAGKETEHAHKILTNRFAALGFHGAIYPVVTDGYSSNGMEQVKNRARTALRQIINNQVTTL